MDSNNWSLNSLVTRIVPPSALAAISRLLEGENVGMDGFGDRVLGSGVIWDVCSFWDDVASLFGGVDVDDLGVDRALLLLANFLSSDAINEIAVLGRLSLSLLFKAPPSFLVNHRSHLKYTK